VASSIDIILKYFPKLTEIQQSQFEQLGDLYTEWNQKINVISRKDIDNLYPHHILHSLAIAKKINFKSGSKVLDLGTGGGMPGIPLAILFPHVQFTLVDGTRKKIGVVQEIADAIGLKNVRAMHIRAEELKEKFDFVICRAVASLDKLYNWSLRLVGNQHKHGLPNGLITLKGGNVKEEIKSLPKGDYIEVWPVTDVFPETFFEEKVMVYVQI
jgi:16S rRNA (guanine527-N7)-methyltransferase